MADSPRGSPRTDGEAELERQRLQAGVWEPEAEALFEQIGVGPGWTCVDLGCGAVGVLGSLSRRVGPSGRVIGVNLDAKQVEAARSFAHAGGLENVQIVEGDAYDTGLPRESIDLVHARFVLAPVGRDHDLLAEMFALARPGGVVVLQEPDITSWACFPPHPAWERLKEALTAAFARGGGDYYVGRRTYGLLRRAGLEDVRVRAAVVALHDRHPYMRALALRAASLRRRIVEWGLLSEVELDETMAACEQIACDPETMVLTFITTQVWGRKPDGVSPP